MTRKISRRVAIQALGGTSLAHAAITKLWPAHKKPPFKYDYVVVGTGYGGSVMAARLASRTKLTVCVLERGKEWRPGSFPDSASELIASVRTAANPGGLFVVNNYQGATLVKASGIGGGSLIDAGVASSPDASVWKHTAWPKAIRAEYEAGEFEKYCALARNVLGVSPHPRAGQMGKAKAMVTSIASGASARTETPGLAINWAIDGKNGQGMSMKPCISCGDCITGCNVGAKNSLDTNYLPMAVSAGAELYGSVNVEWIEKLKPGGYRLHLRVYESGSSRLDTLDAVNVILAAGSPGSAEILLRSEVHGLSVSPQAGARFGGNGEVTCAAYGTERRTDVIGWGSRLAEPAAQRLGVVPPGSAVVEGVMVQGRQTGTPFWIQDLSCPSAMVGGMRVYLPIIRGTSGIQDATVREKRNALLLIDSDPFGSKQDEGALNHSVLYWGTGLEEPTGKFVIEAPRSEPAGRLKLQIPPSRNTGDAILAYIHQQALTLSPYSVIYNFLWSIFNVRPPGLTQPLGGCPMGESMETGAVNHLGEVFDGGGGIHRGLYVADASIIPAPLGVGPLLTVAALAERCADLILKPGGSQK